MTKDQKIVATGAVSGIAGMLISVWAFSTLVEPPALAHSAADRIAYALRWAVVAILPYFAMLAAIGNARFLGEAIDPTLGREDRKTIITGRVADNTLQQFVLFFIGMLGLAVTLRIERLSVVAAVAITFVIFRIVFWIGYRIHPLYRAPGFAATAYMNLGMLLASLWLWLNA